MYHLTCDALPHQGAPSWLREGMTEKPPGMLLFVMWYGSCRAVAALTSLSRHSLVCVITSVPVDHPPSYFHTMFFDTEYRFILKRPQVAWVYDSKDSHLVSV